MRIGLKSNNVDENGPGLMKNSGDYVACIQSVWDVWEQAGGRQFNGENNNKLPSINFSFGGELLAS